MSIMVTLPYDPVWTALDWAKKNCPSYIANDCHRASGSAFDARKIDYFFGNEQDALLFVIKWAK